MERYPDIRIEAPCRSSRRAQALKALGIVDGKRFGAEPRWLLFAAAGGRGLGYSRLRDADYGGVWSLERGGFRGRAQVGLAWLQGDYQSSLSYVREEIDIDLFGAQDIDEDQGMLTLTRFLGDPHRSLPRSVRPGPGAAAACAIGAADRPIPGEVALADVATLIQSVIIL